MVTVLTGCPDPNIVIFGDPGLEAAVRAELNQPFGFLNRNDLLDVVELDAASRGIESLQGIENLHNLLILDLTNNAVASLSPLSTLTNLTILNLDSNRITSLAPLAGLFNLDELYLTNLYESEHAGNTVWDLAPLVTNAENGGLGAGDLVALDSQTLVDTETELLVPTVAAQIARLQQLGVEVVLTEEIN
jgi:hypothetical protein